MLQALKRDRVLMQLAVELADAGHSWQLSDPDGVKVFVAPAMYEQVLACLQSKHFSGPAGEPMLLNQLRRWHIVVSEEL